MRRIPLIAALLCLVFSTIHAIPPQSSDKQDLQELISYTAELEVQTELVQYVYEQYLRHGEETIPEQKFLISLMDLVNREVSKRLKNPGKARKKYFGELHGMLEEIEILKRRLKAANIRELDTFVNDLSRRIKITIDRGEVDFKKKKVFEDGLQMLYVSEETIKMDQSESPGDISANIARSKERLLKAFGEVDNDDGNILGRPPTIYDLFVEWRRTEEVKYSLRLADVRLARKNLLKSAGLQEVQRMFNEEIKLAYTRFNYADYELAELLLSDVSEEYPLWGIRNIDDVLFYKAESNFALNRLMHAEEDYNELIRQYPSTTYLAEVYGRLVQIHYTMNNYGKVVEFANLYQNLAALSNPEYYDIQFLQSMAHYQMGNFDETVATLLNVPEGHAYYYLAQYFIGNAYLDSDLLDDAVTSYLKLVNDLEAPAYLHARSLYKLSVVEYERDNYLAAINYLNEVAPGFSQYDKVLNALAWCYYEVERSKPAGEKRDFSQARFYAKRLIADYYASPYKMEATGLLAYINQSENEPLEAIDLYREVYQEKVKRGSIETYIGERNRLESLHRDAIEEKEAALREGNSEAYIRATDLIARLQVEIHGLDISETSSSGLLMFQEANAVIDQIKELNQLRLAAEESNNSVAVDRIDSLRVRLGAILETFPDEVFDPKSRVNFFDDYPVSKYVTEEELHHQQLEQKKKEVLDEIARIDMLVKEMDGQIVQASSRNNFDLVAKYEQKRRHLLQLKKRYDFLYVGIQETSSQENPYPEFNRWGDLGAFGIINVYFDQKQKSQGKLVKVADVFERVNKQLNYRKQVIEDKIKKIESEVRFMTMKARMEERARLRAERERAFRESYFDTRESETQDDQQQ